MSPLAETLFSLLIVVVVLLAVCWLFGCFKKRNNQEAKESFSPEPEPQPEPQPEPLYSPLVETTEVPKLNYAPDIPTKTVNGRTYSYVPLEYWCKHTDGEYYQIIQSNYGGRFFVNKDGKRYYITHKPLSELVKFQEK